MKTPRTAREWKAVDAALDLLADDAVIEAAARVRLSWYASEYTADHLSPADFAGEAREMLDAVRAEIDRQMNAAQVQP
jgi:hypothetical protein